MIDYSKIAKKFWQKQKKYPSYLFLKERRLYELNYLVPKLIKAKTFLDLGCGDGALIKCLQQLTNVEKYYGYDVSSSLMKDFEKLINTKVYDCNFPTALPKTDITIIGGVLPFLFEDSVVNKLFEEINSKTTYLRTPCTLEKKDEVINTYSTQLSSIYSAKYRTLKNTTALLKKKFKIINKQRIYPDSIESKFNTKQYYFELKKL